VPELGSSLVVGFLAIMLASARPLAMMVLIPAFTWVSLSPSIRFGAAAAFGAPVAWGLMDGAGQVALENIDVMYLGVLVLAEVCIGLVLGLVIAMPMYAAQLAGELADEVRGVQNPAGEQFGEMEAPGVTATLLLLCAIAVFYLAGGMRAALEALYSSWNLFPIGADFPALSTQMPETIFSLLLALLKSGLVLAAPFIVIALIGQFSMAFSAAGLRGLDVEGTAFSVKNLLILIVLVVYSLFIFDAIARETARFGNPVAHLGQILQAGP
jgi:type III secretion protein T